MRRLELGSNSHAAMSVDQSKEKNSPNIDNSSSFQNRNSMHNNGASIANDTRRVESPLYHLQQTGRNRRSYSLVTSLERL